MPKVLITGANGLIGSRLQEMLRSEGYTIRTIGRGQASTFTWDLETGKMDIAALEEVDTIIHLAGAGVADARWTDARKKEILDSRVRSTRLLYDTLSSMDHQVKTIVSASAVGYYGDCGDETVTEDHPSGKGFLADVTRQWEAEVNRMEQIGIRHVCCRIGIVLAQKGGALPALTKTLPIGIAGYFAKAPLYYPWIHIDDVCGIMTHGLQNEQVRGSYNTTAPVPLPIRELMKAILSVRKSSALLMPIPEWPLKMAMGEMADMLLISQRCSDEKIRATGYKFHFPDLAGALADIYRK